MFTKQFIPESVHEHAHWRVSDHHDNRVATCYDVDNADACVHAFNELEKEQLGRRKLASMCETVMRCVLELESAESEALRPPQVWGEVAKKLRAAVLAAT